MTKIGILLTNTGTPLAPTTREVRRYLREFLSDKRIVQLPRLIWLPILYGLVLTIRPKRSAKLYKKIWTAQGSPMRVIMNNMAALLQKKLMATYAQDFAIEIGMNYGTPSISQSLKSLQNKQVDKIIVLPLFPQYSNTTTASTFDRVNRLLKNAANLPEICLIRDYADDNNYIRALVSSVKNKWQHKGVGEHLLISFHGIPQRFVHAGDPYALRCEKTAELIAKELGIAKEKWTLCYQSQFGYDKWLKPSTQTLFAELPARGIKHIDVVCPGFSVDCLETLEEIAIRGEETFHAAGGKSLDYIPALNDSEQHMEMLVQMIARRL